MLLVGRNYSSVKVHGNGEDIGVDSWSGSTRFSPFSCAINHSGGGVWLFFFSSSFLI